MEEDLGWLAIVDLESTKMLGTSELSAGCDNETGKTSETSSE